MKSKLRILITTHFFYPENTPRAFRACELALEFPRRRHEVKVYTRHVYADYTELAQLPNLSVVPIAGGVLLNRARKSISTQITGSTSPSKALGTSNPIASSLRKGLQWIYPGGKSFE